MSATEIAVQMHAPSRNAVSGALYRLNLFRSNVNAVSYRRKIRVEPPKPKLVRKRLPPEVIALVAPTEPATPEVLPNSAGEAIMWLTKRSCRFPYGDPFTKNFYFCSGEKIPGSSYCAFHSNLCMSEFSKEKNNGRPRR